MKSVLRNTVSLVYLNNQELTIASSEKYLGHVISCDLSDTNDLQGQIRAFYGRSNTLIRNFSKCSFDVKLSLFRTYCTNIYCNSLWSYFLVSDMHKLNVAYNNCIRKLFQLSCYTSISEWSVQHNIPTFLFIRRRSLYSVASRIKKSSNCIVRAAYCSRKLYKSPFWDMYCHILFR